MVAVERRGNRERLTEPEEGDEAQRALASEAVTVNRGGMRVSTFASRSRPRLSVVRARGAAFAGRGGGLIEGTGWQRPARGSVRLAGDNLAPGRACKRRRSIPYSNARLRAPCPPWCGVGAPATGDPTDRFGAIPLAPRDLGPDVDQRVGGAERAARECARTGVRTGAVRGRAGGGESRRGQARVRVTRRGQQSERTSAPARAAEDGERRGGT